MNLQQLRTFLQVAESGSLSKAAQRLRIAQPALTRQMHMLEESLQSRLLDRHSRGVALTEAGQRFRPRAAAILREIDHTRDEFRTRSGSISGSVSLAVAPALVDLLLGPLIESFSVQNPDVTIALTEGFTGFLEEWLSDGRIDLAVLYDPQPGKHLRLETLATERLYLVGPAGQALAPDAAVPVSRLANYDLVTASRHERLRGVIDDAAAQSGVTLSVAIEANALGIQKALVRHGVGYAILPYGAVVDDVARGRLTAAPLADPPIVWPVVLAQPAQARPSVAAAALASAIRAQVARLKRDGAYPGLAPAS